MENGPFIDDFPSYKPPFMRDFPWYIQPRAHSVFQVGFYGSSLAPWMYLFAVSKYLKLE
jgi:hypothetical protein